MSECFIFRFLVFVVDIRVYYTYIVLYCIFVKWVEGKISYLQRDISEYIFRRNKWTKFGSIYIIYQLRKCSARQLDYNMTFYSVYIYELEHSKNIILVNIPIYMKCFKFLFIYNKQHKNDCTVDIRGQQRSNRISHRVDKSSHFHEKSPRNSLRKYIYKSILYVNWNIN